MEPVPGNEDELRLHCVDGPALRYRDGWPVYAIHGVRVDNPDWIIDRSQLTPDRILAEENAEVRRVMVDQYGTQRFLGDAGAVLIHEDPEWGKLWRREMPGDEPLVMVEVVNSSPEPDGHFKDYFIRVPPTMTETYAAIAWTFPLKDGQRYAPEVQT